MGNAKCDRYWYASTEYEEAYFIEAYLFYGRFWHITQEAFVASVSSCCMYHTALYGLKAGARY